MVILSKSHLRKFWETLTTKSFLLQVLTLICVRASSRPCLATTLHLTLSLSPNTTARGQSSWLKVNQQGQGHDLCLGIVTFMTFESKSSKVFEYKVIIPVVIAIFTETQKIQS